MSVYISIACLDIDQELIKTIKSAKDNSSNPENITISVALIGNKKFFDYVKKETSMYSKIILEYYDFDKNFGVGMSRWLAASKHTNEKYFLQVDAHTFFAQNWDTFLIKKINDVRKKIKKEKIILSALPGAYLYYDKDGNKNFQYTGDTSYPQYIKDEFLMELEKPIEINKLYYNKIIPRFKDMSYKYISEKLDKNLYKEFKKNDFGPLHKISAAFIFTDSFHFGNTFVEKDAYFWEEEITQSINLMDEGYTLVYAGKNIPVMHFYIQYLFNGEGNRMSLSKLMENEMDFYRNKIINNWISYFSNEDNHSKIKNYEGYANLSILNGPEQEWFLPEDYSG
jgi:hypothetical protein